MLLIRWKTWWDAKLVSGLGGKTSCRVTRSLDTGACPRGLLRTFITTGQLQHPAPRNARQAIARLIAAGDSATALLRTKLVAASEIREERISGLVADLDHDSFVRREKASKELEKLLPRVRPALENALAITPSLEVQRRIKSLLALRSLVVRDAEPLREIRAVQVLEHVATSGANGTRLSAIDLTKNLAAGAPEARLRQDAKATVERVVMRATAKP